MKEEIEVFDFHRIFLGEEPASFMLEIVFRTLIMYGYTTFLLRLLGKRGMGQMSTLELAIIIAFGSAVGDPMVMDDVPILHGITAITVVTIIQYLVERFASRSRKVETLLEGTARLVVDNGVVRTDYLHGENISQEDLFRELRIKEVDHLGQVHKAYFETSGHISVSFLPPKRIKPGLSVLPPDDEIHAPRLKTGSAAAENGPYCCMNCGNTVEMHTGETLPVCAECGHKEWTKAVLEE